MRKLVLFVAVLVAGVVLAKDLEFEPGFAGYAGPTGSAGAWLAPSAPGTMTLDPGVSIEVLALVVREDGRLVRVHEVASSPANATSFGSAFSGVESVTRLICQPTEF